LSTFVTVATCSHPTVWMRPAIWLVLCMRQKSQSPQRSWWGLVLAKTHPVQWGTLYNI